MCIRDRGMDTGDIYDEVPEDSSGYTASMNISTGDYYARDGVLYEMVFGTNGTGENGDLGIVFHNKAEVINYLFDTFGWVYGADYDLIRMFHYDATVSAGNRTGAYDFHCAFAYRALEQSGAYDGLSGEEAFYSENENKAGLTNYGTLFIQDQPENAGTYVIENLKALCFTRPDGPQEATNFYGLGSAVVVDGGTPSKDEGYATKIYAEEDTTTLDLVSPNINGGANPIYALASSLVRIKGGTLFTAFSGGHGPYSSLQGQITINADENLIAEDGTINVELDSLAAGVLTERPGRFGWAVRNTDENGQEVSANDYDTVHAKLELDAEAIADYEKENGDVTVVTTANSSGSLLVTDSGGGIIVANKVSGTAYSTGSSGVYAMGGGSYVYVYNSRLESHIEPALNSVGEGYIFAYNSDQMCIRDRAGIVYDTRLSFSFGERENACFDAWSTNKNASNILGSATTLTAEENTDASAIYSDILTYVATEVLKFINGSMDVNDDAVWNDYVSKIEAMGIDELTDIVQGAYDRANP